MVKLQKSKLSLLLCKMFSLRKQIKNKKRIGLRFKDTGKAWPVSTLSENTSPCLLALVSKSV